MNILSLSKADKRFRLRNGTYRDDLGWVGKYETEKILLNGKALIVGKRILDLLIIVLTLPVTLPILLLTIFLLKAVYPDRKVFYKQKRTGKGGKRFWMFKFQTMVPDAEELKPSLMDLNALKWPDFKIIEDPRVTKAGKFLRKTSIDELPQILNVIKGEMSLVGPRPTSFSSDTYKAWQTERLEVIPGMTGLWQITHRGESDFKERMLLDIAYIKHRCILLDLEILLRTLFSIWAGNGTT